MYSEPSQQSKIKPFFSFQKLAKISGNCVKFPMESIKTSVAIEMFKTENHWKTPQVVDTADGTRHTRKRGLRTLKKTLSLRALKTILSLKILKTTVSLSTLKSALSLRTLKGPNQRLTPPCRLQ